MSEINLTRLDKTAWDPAVIEAIGRLISSSYLPGSTLLSDELLRCDTLYVVTDPDGLLAFQFVATVRLPVGAEAREARYLGLAGVRQGRRAQAAEAAIYERLVADAHAEEEASGVRPVFFAATATPFSPAAESVWAAVQPSREGTFPEGMVPLARAAAFWLGTRPCDERPYVLQGLRRGTRYSFAERQRIARAVQEQKFEHLERFGIDEANGDRLLVFCALPAAAPPVVEAAAA